MNAVICVDQCNGMMFNGRRQSRDLKQREDLCRLLEGKDLYLSPYSSDLFAGLSGPRITVSPRYLEICTEDGWCYIEDGDINRYFKQVEKLIIYQWNRRYPADVFFTESLDTFRMKEQKEFPGSSHDRITRRMLERI